MENTKRGLKDNTFQNYQYLYELFISESIGKITITNLQKNRYTFVL